MVPAEYGNYLVASTGASAALLGLLFVSISIAPERVFGSAAEAGHRALALSSFTALANAFFVGLSGLIPHVTYGWLIVVAGAIAISQTLSLLVTARNWRRDKQLLRGITLFVAATFIYGSEIAIGFQLTSAVNPTGLLTGLLELLLGVFAIGLVRAWELLGAPQSRGLGSGAIEWIERRVQGGKPGAAGGPKPD